MFMYFRLLLDFETADSNDCLGQASQTVEFPANVTEKNVTLCTVQDDKLLENSPETFKATLNASTFNGDIYVNPDKSEKTFNLTDNEGKFKIMVRKYSKYSIFDVCRLAYDDENDGI